MKKNKEVHDIQKYISDVFRERLAELDMSQYRFCKENPDIKILTLHNILNCKYSPYVTTLAEYCDKLGMEIIIRPKKNENKGK